MQRFLFFTLFIIFINQLFAQNENFVRITNPWNDTTRTSYSVKTISGSTKPGSKVTINGKEQKLYPSGAFVVRMDLDEGENLFSIVSKSEQYGEAQKELMVIYKKRQPEKATESFEIEYMKTIPDMDLQLTNNDIIRVKIKAKPDCKAFFLDTIPMFELPESQTNGVKGIYHGQYRIKNRDKMNKQTVTVCLVNSKGDTITKNSKTSIEIISSEIPVIGITKGDFPYLNYGLGKDRLGGAKTGYLDTLVKLAIDGKFGESYRVKLSENHHALIPEQFVEILPKGTFIPKSLIGSWFVYGDEKYDYIKITMNERLPYTSYMEMNPSGIIVDIYGGIANTNWLTQRQSIHEIALLDYVQVEEDVFRVIITLKHKQHWGYKIYYENNRLVIRIKHQPERLRLKNLTIAIDAGHGGRHSGAVGPTGLTEKEVNLAIAFALKSLLERKGANVIMTRVDDQYSNNLDRMIKLVEQDPDILVSIHNNAGGNPLKTRGTSTYYKHIGYRKLSQFILAEMLDLGLKDFGNIGKFNFTLNSPTEFPNVLVEGAFMSNPEDEMKLLDPKFRAKMAKAIYKGLKSFLRDCR